MIFFELVRGLDIRVFQTVSAIDPTYGSCAKYVFDKDSLVLLGMNHSIRLDILTKEIKKDNPIKNWDIESEAVMWFAEDSTEAVIIRLINDAYRKWHNLDANITNEYFAKELHDANEVLKAYDFKIFVDNSGMSIFKNDEAVSFEQAIEVIMDIDENNMDDNGIENLISEALFYRKMDRYDDAALRLEKVVRYVDHKLPMYSKATFTLAETYYFAGNYERAEQLYYRVNLEHIEDENDFYMHLGHALLDGRMKRYDRHLRIYYHSSIDPEFADTHRQAVAAAKSNVAEVFADYEVTCLEMGQKKYKEHKDSLPTEADDIDELLELYEKPEEKPMPVHKKYEGIRLVEPKNVKEISTKTLNERLSEALDLFLAGEYQESFEYYCRLKEQADKNSDFYSWICLQLGKLYCFFDEPEKAKNILNECNPNRFGIVYRQEDFLVLYRHTRIVADDFENDIRYRRLLRGMYDPYFAQYDREYNLMIKDKKLMKAFGLYVRECEDVARSKNKDVLEGAGKGGIFGLFKKKS